MIERQVQRDPKSGHLINHPAFHPGPEAKAWTILALVLLSWLGLWLGLSAFNWLLERSL